MESILQGGQFKKLLEEQSLELRRKYDLKKAELDILYFLSRSGANNTSTDIHHQLLMNRGHISQAVESLIKRKFIVAIPDQNDRRYVHYELLESAGAIIHEMTKMREETNALILEGISEEELQAFQAVSEKIRANIEKMIQTK